jgi:hypothetical protein
MREGRAYKCIEEAIQSKIYRNWVGSAFKGSPSKKWMIFFTVFLRRSFLKYMWFIFINKTLSKRVSNQLPVSTIRAYFFNSANAIFFIFIFFFSTSWLSVRFYEWIYFYYELEWATLFSFWDPFYLDYPNKQTNYYWICSFRCDDFFGSL